VRVFRPEDGEAEANADALYWNRIPVDERAEFVWHLSVELYGLVPRDARHESGLSRSIARITRR
jgi:hypothetical protein